MVGALSGMWDLHFGYDGRDMSHCALCEEFIEWSLWRSSGGKCEVDRETDCGWHLIVDRLTELGQLDRYEQIIR